MEKIMPLQKKLCFNNFLNKVGKYIINIRHIFSKELVKALLVRQLVAKKLLPVARRQPCKVLHYQYTHQCTFAAPKMLMLLDSL